MFPFREALNRVTNPYYSEPLVFVDLETTGATPASDRITEIGIVQVDDDGVRRWSSLVNPQQPIPPFIQRLTGIDDAMVADAPTFAELAETVLAKLQGRVFVAHNARFDYGFLKQECQRLGLRFSAPVLCTVKLSRKLYPKEFKHSLDALVARHGLAIDGDRHRALSDAALLPAFLDVALREHPVEVVQQAIAELLRQPRIPAGLDPAVIDELPETGGCYTFYAIEGAALLVGRSHNIRKRVLQHFAADARKPRELEMLGKLTRIDWREAAGEFGAMLDEARLIRTLKPVYNPRPKKSTGACVLRLSEHDRALIPEVVDLAALGQIDPQRDFVFGPFRARRDAQRLLDKLADGTGLCRQLLGLEPRPVVAAPCSAQPLGKCRGACIGHEPLATHNARLLSLLAKHSFADWPYPGPVGLVEGPEWAPEIHVIDRWCHLGVIHEAAELGALQAAGPAEFDFDAYKLIQFELKRRAGEVLRF
ncbi:exonuclease domain-containing protein [Jeongeupia wiesaeckerbachi]|uniref:exonuclease domain-containing protein n=1 Tax=Jeongeupia wiesaeckerbachi TaxID=3051218 RepID=UPI003D8071C9